MRARRALIDLYIIRLIFAFIFLSLQIQVWPGGTTAVAGVAGTASTLVEAGIRHSCALTADGVAWCWGANDVGQLGDGSTASRTYPAAVDMPAGTQFKEIAASGFQNGSHTCALAIDGTAWCWGLNDSGQIGDATTLNRLVPTAVVMPEGKTFVHISAGQKHACAIATDGSGWCWGAGALGQLGDGWQTNWSIPMPIDVVGTFTQISAGSLHTCALTKNGTAWCWGYGAEGVLGNGTRQNFAVPWSVSMPAGRTFKQIGSGADHTCAIANDDTAWCWGNNAYGKLGSGTSSTRELVPTAVVMPGGTSFLQVSPGRQHTCAVAADGTAWCWGYNGSGRLGDNSTTSRATPTRSLMPSGMSFTLISTGEAHTCALGTDGETWCWGQNFYGQLGEGSTINRLIPTYVGAPLSVVKTSSGSGTVTSDLSGIACGTTCSAVFDWYASVVLTATASAGYSFTGWSGEGCSGTGTCVIVMNQARNVTATFTRNTYALTVTKPGTGTGSVSSSPAGIICGAICSANFNYNASVTLTASASSDSTFTGWSGEGCSGTGTCSVLMTQARNVTANFTLKSYALAVTRSGAGSGRVSSSPAGIDCGSICTFTFNHGTSVTLTQVADAGSTFSGWSGACSGTGACTVSMTGSRSVGASFTINTYALTVTKSGAGTGLVSSSPAGISCGATCSANFNYNTLVTLSAVASTGSNFTGWTGEGCSGTGICQVSMTQVRGVTATFAVNSFALNVTKAGTGSGTITSSPTGISCGSTCSANFDYLTSVSLSATAAAGYGFVGWSGEGCSGSSECVVYLTQARNVTATFGYNLSLSKNSAVAGVVTSSPAGISCGTFCSGQIAAYVSGTVVLTAAPSPGYTFRAWSGACSGMSICSVSMTASRNVTATFGAVLSLSKNVAKGGTITSSPTGISCGTTCSSTFANFAVDTTITLTAKLSGPYRSVAWTNCTPVIGKPLSCTVTLAAATTVLAAFA